MSLTHHNNLIKNIFLQTRQERIQNIKRQSCNIDPIIQRHQKYSQSTERRVNYNLKADYIKNNQQKDDIPHMKFVYRKSTVFPNETWENVQSHKRNETLKEKHENKAKISKNVSLKIFPSSSMCTSGYNDNNRSLRKQVLSPQNRHKTYDRLFATGDWETELKDKDRCLYKSIRHNKERRDHLQELFSLENKYMNNVIPGTTTHISRNKRITTKPNYESFEIMAYKALQNTKENLCRDLA